jgi:hypothetical protein
MLSLSNKWAPVLVAQPETGMGYQIASVVLRDGRQFDHVMIVGGIITEIAGSKEIPFAEDQIVEIRVNHGM